VAKRVAPDAVWRRKIVKKDVSIKKLGITFLQVYALYY
jgi:hypothetical protein